MGKVADRARAELKRSRALHSAYKFLKLVPDCNPLAWLNIPRTRLILRVLPNTMVSARGLIEAYDCVKAVEREGIEGDLAECGVWAGGTIGLMAAASEDRRRVHLFDSFEGLPQPSAQDVDILDEFQAQHPDLDLDSGDDGTDLTAIGACAAPLEAVRELFDDVLRIDPRRVVIRKGWFQETVPRAAAELDCLAVLRIDGDWYESTKVCLEGLYDRVAERGFILIDDYDEFAGCRRAVDEFLAGRGIDVELTHVAGAGVHFRKPARERAWKALVPAATATAT